MRKYTVAYFQCSSCGFIQTEDPYWLQESYKSSINISDTGIVLRNHRLSKITTSLIILFFNTNEKLIDYAGGYGLFTRMMRDIGFDFYWSDPYTPNLLARTFESEKGKKYHLATSFESFEHFVNPIDEVSKILEISDNIILSTELVPYPVPSVGDWWYYAPTHGQHISFYTKKTFLKLAKLYNLHYYNIDNIQLLTKNRISLPGRIFLQFRFAKQLLYVLSYFISPFLKSKTIDDMHQTK